MGNYMFFVTKEDVAIRLVLPLLVYGEIYMGIWLISFYRENSERFTEIGKSIRFMPAIWMIQWGWNIVDFLLGSALYRFYRNCEDIMTSGYVFDYVTIFSLLMILIIKLYPIVFMHLKYTICSVIMLIVAIGFIISILFIFAVNDKWGEFCYMFPYLLWHLYLVYINFNWARVVHMKKAGIL